MSGRIIFLDIDGPMIPSGMMFIDSMASWQRQFSPICVAILVELLEKTGAKLVTNSTHNVPMKPFRGSGPARELRDDLIAAGVPEESFHEDWRTEYPAYPRDVAVQKWLAEHGRPEWLAFDDVRFTDDPRLIWVDFDTGLTPAHFNAAAEKCGIAGVLIL